MVRLSGQEARILRNLGPPGSTGETDVLRQMPKKWNHMLLGYLDLGAFLPSTLSQNGLSSPESGVYPTRRGVEHDSRRVAQNQ